MLSTHTRPLTRRQFAGTALAASFATSLALSESSAPTRRHIAAVIGHTGRGDYGHGLDEAFASHPALNLVAIADANPDGLKKAAERTRAPRQYLDYREMLKKEQPGIVAIAPRHTDQHHAMALAALHAGAHLYCEKPFTTSLDESDELLAVASKTGRKIAVAHQMRLAPQVVHLVKWLKAGGVGEIVSMQSHGKQDRRAGGEDMIVLGTHLFDMMRLIAGDAVSCQAWIRQNGKPASQAQTKPATENIGPVLGDEIEARFEFASGVTGSFVSRARLRETLGPWGLTIQGTRGAALILMDIFPRVFVRTSFDNGVRERREHWQPLTDDPSLQLVEAERGFPAANRRVVNNLLASIEQTREPECGGENAAKALEMAMAAYHSSLTDSRCAIPMTRREHPLRS